MNTPFSENQASNVLPNHLTQAHQTQETSTPHPQGQLPQTPSQNDAMVFYSPFLPPYLP